jgi:hypothetical protein
MNRLLLPALCLGLAVPACGPAELEPGTMSPPAGSEVSSEHGLAGATPPPVLTVAEDDKPLIPAGAGQGSSAAAELMAAQAPLVAAADAIEAFSRAPAFTSQFGGIELSVADREVRVAWKGTVPGSLRAKLRELASERVRITLRPAAFSRAELRAEARRLVADDIHHPDVVSAAPLPDGSGLVVGMAPEAVAGATRRLATAFTVPVRVQAEAPFTPYSRLNDTSPWWAGARANACSTGFGISRNEWSFPFTWTRRYYVPTADHCGMEGTVFSDDFGEVIGTVTDHDYDLGVSLIQAYSGSATWDGGVNDGTEFSKPVEGASGNYVGMFVCASGASTGVHCGIQVKETGKSSDGYEDLVIAEQVHHTLAAGGGDSGGPVFVLAADPSRVRAVGLIQGGSRDPAYSAACTYFGTRCSWQLWYTDFNAILSGLGADLRVAQ